MASKLIIPNVYNLDEIVILEVTINKLNYVDQLAEVIFTDNCYVDYGIDPDQAFEFLYNCEYDNPFPTMAFEIGDKVFLIHYLLEDEITTETKILTHSNKDITPMCYGDFILVMGSDPDDYPWEIVDNERVINSDAYVTLYDVANQLIVVPSDFDTSYTELTFPVKGNDSLFISFMEEFFERFENESILDDFVFPINTQVMSDTVVSTNSSSNDTIAYTDYGPYGGTAWGPTYFDDYISYVNAELQAQPSPDSIDYRFSDSEELSGDFQRNVVNFTSFFSESQEDYEREYHHLSLSTVNHSVSNANGWWYNNTAHAYVYYYDGDHVSVAGCGFYNFTSYYFGQVVVLYAPDNESRDLEWWQTGDDIHYVNTRTINGVVKDYRDNDNELSSFNSTLNVTSAVGYAFPPDTDPTITDPAYHDLEDCYIIQSNYEVPESVIQAVRGKIGVYYFSGMQFRSFENDVFYDTLWTVNPQQDPFECLNMSSNCPFVYQTPGKYTLKFEEEYTKTALLKPHFVKYKDISRPEEEIGTTLWNDKIYNSTTNGIDVAIENIMSDIQIEVGAASAQFYYFIYHIKRT